MTECEFNNLLLQVQDLQKTARQLQDKADALVVEVGSHLGALVEERNLLRWRVDPFSVDADSLADLEF